MATALGKAFENITPEQREQTTKYIGEMRGIPSHVQKRQAASRILYYLNKEDLQKSIRYCPSTI